MLCRKEPVPRVGLASILAGPLFLLCWLIADLAVTTPQTFRVDQSLIAPYLFVLLASSIVGFGPALAACWIGAAALIAAARDHAWAGTPEVWLATGAILAGIPSYFLFDAEPTVWIGMAGGGAICALIVHHSVASSL